LYISRQRENVCCCDQLLCPRFEFSASSNWQSGNCRSYEGHSRNLSNDRCLRLRPIYVSSISVFFHEMGMGTSSTI
jgi:hypothetical protein